MKASVTHALFIILAGVVLFIAALILTGFFTKKGMETAKKAYFLFARRIFAPDTCNRNSRCYPHPLKKRYKLHLKKLISWDLLWTPNYAPRSCESIERSSNL